MRKMRAHWRIVFFSVGGALLGSLVCLHASKRSSLDLDGFPVPSPIKPPPYGACFYLKENDTVGLKSFYTIWEDSDYPARIFAAKKLYEEFNGPEKTAVASLLEEALQNPKHPNHYLAAKILFNLGTSSKRRTASGAYLQMLRNPTNAHRWSIALDLFESNIDDYHKLGAQFLKEVLEDPKNPYHRTHGHYAKWHLHPKKASDKKGTSH